MDVQKIVDTDVPTISAETTMGSLRSKFQNSLPKGVIVTDKNGYVGIVEEKKLMNSHIQNGTKADRLAESAPRINAEKSVRDTARMMVNASCKVAPFFDDDEIAGVVTQNSIVKAVKNNLDVINVEDICTEDVITVDRDATLGEAISKIRQNGISRLPVEDNNKLKGIVTTQDIVSVTVRSQDSVTTGDRSGESNKISQLPITNVMSSPVNTVDINENVKHAVEIMLENDHGGLVVSSDKKDIYGVLTKTDAIRSLTVEESEDHPVQITNVNLMDRLDRETIEDELKSIVSKYQDLDVHYSHVRFHIESSNTRRGEKLIQCTIRMQTNKRQVAGSGDGYGSNESFKVACDKLERNVLDIKGMNNPKSAEFERWSGF